MFRQLTAATGLTVYYTITAFRVLRRVSLTALTTIYYRITCAEFGANSVVRWGTWIRYPQNVFIGDNVFIDNDVAIASEFKDSRLHLASSVHLNRGVGIDYTGGVVIGERTLISEQAKIYSHSHGLDPSSKAVPMPKEIGSDCWIGVRSTVLEGASVIASNSIIGAGAVLTKSIEVSGIYAGVPARLVRAFE